MYFYFLSNGLLLRLINWGEKHTHLLPPSWIHKFVMATRGCRISHKDTEHTDKCSNNKTKITKKHTMKPQTNTFSKYWVQTYQTSFTDK
jgi:hypothetical protein